MNKLEITLHRNHRIAEGMKGIFNLQETILLHQYVSSNIYFKLFKLNQDDILGTLRGSVVWTIWTNL